MDMGEIHLSVSRNKTDVWIIKFFADFSVFLVNSYYSLLPLPTIRWTSLSFSQHLVFTSVISYPHYRAINVFLSSLIY